VSTVAVEQPVDLGGVWHSIRVPILIIVAALALVAVLAAVTSTNRTALDPRSTSPAGTHALAVLLAGRGVVVGVPDSVGSLTAAADRGDTVVLAEPGNVADSVLRALAGSRATVLLVAPLDRELTAFAVPASFDNREAGQTLSPSCAVPAATVAGTIQFSGDLYAVRAAASGCYPAGADRAMVVAGRAGGGRTVVLGGGSPLSNADLAHSGDAALAVGLLDGAPRLQWVPPGTLGGASAPADRRGLFSLLPAGLDWGLLQLAIALAVFALWRARRLGRPVVEPLPVVVRAAETVEGNARLLQAANARGSAAAALRVATRRRLGGSMRLGQDPDPGALVDVVAERTGQQPGQVHALLYGAEPLDDPGLVSLAGALPELERAVRQDPLPGSTMTSTDPTPGGQQ
jgi:hypothetical protein